MSCGDNDISDDYDFQQCDFNGIEGVLPSTISRLLNLEEL
jgi:hypothetical protein